MIFASFLIIMLVIDSSMEAFDPKAFIDKTNELRGQEVVKGMNKLILDSELSVASECPTPRDKAHKQDVSNENHVTISFILKATRTDAASDLPHAVTTVKTAAELGTPKKYSSCSAQPDADKKVRCQIYLIFLYGGFSHANVNIRDCNDNSGTYTNIFYTFKTKLTNFDSFEIKKDTVRDPCGCSVTRKCEFVPASSGTLTSRLCIARPPNEDPALVATFNSWRAASVDLTRDTSLQAAAVNSAKSICAPGIFFERPDSTTLVALLKNGAHMDTSNLGLKALLDTYSPSATADTYSGCKSTECQAFLVLKSNKFTKVGIAAMNCVITGTSRTLIAIVLSPHVSKSELDKEYLPLTVLNDWRKSVVSTVSPVTSTAAIKSKADTEVAKCATAVNVDDAEVALVSEKLGSKFTDVDAIRDQVKTRLDAYKTAAKGKARQEDCSTLSGDDQRFCKIFFMMIYAAYTNGEVAIKNDCSDSKTVITFALSKKPANYEYVNTQGIVDPPKSTTTAKGGGSNDPQDGQSTTTRSAASTVFTGLGYGISLLIIAPLLH